MGQSCCRPQIKEDIELQSKHPGNLKYVEITTGGDEEDDFWDARSVGSDFSFLSVDDLLEMYEDELHGDIRDLDSEVEEMRRFSGRLVSQEIIDAAHDNLQTGEAPPFPTKTPRTEPQLDLDRVKHKLQEYVSPSSSIHVKAAPDVVAVSLNDPSVVPDIQLANTLYEQCRILEAYNLLHSICTKYGFDSIDQLNITSFDVKALQADVDAVHASLTALDDDTDWMVSRNGNSNGDLRVLYHHTKGTTRHSLKFRAVFPHHAEHILALAHEWDLIKLWNKFTLEAIKLAEPSIFESYVYGSQWMMPPFRSMQAIVKARGFDLAETHQCLLILIHDVEGGIENLPQGHAPLPVKNMDKRRTVNVFPGSCIKLQPLSAHPVDGTPRTDAHLLVHLDPHIPFVPSSLVNFVLGILAPYIYNQMNKALEEMFADEAGVFSTRIKEQRELYGLVESRMNEVAKKRGIDIGKKKLKK